MVLIKRPPEMLTNLSATQQAVPAAPQPAPPNPAIYAQQAALLQQQRQAAMAQHPPAMRPSWMQPMVRPAPMIQQPQAAPQAAPMVRPAPMMQRPGAQPLPPANPGAYPGTMVRPAAMIQQPQAAAIDPQAQAANQQKADEMARQQAGVA